MPGSYWTSTEFAEAAGAHRGQVPRWAKYGYGEGKPLRFVWWLFQGGCKGAKELRIDRASGERFLKAKARLDADRSGLRQGALLALHSENHKLGKSAATYAAKQSCPEDCAFRGAGCYAEYDHTGQHWNRLTAGAVGMTPVEVALEEARLIDLIGRTTKDLRLHVAGDSKTREGTRAIAAACGRYMDRARRPVQAWTYTHAWKTVPRKDWGRVSVLASCETAGQVRKAWRRGYAASIVVATFPGPKAYDHDGVRVIPCPAQTSDRTCSQCRLCMDDKRLRESKLVIGFEVHGSGDSKAAGAVKRINLTVVKNG